MPILSVLERRSPKGKGLLGVFYLLLAIGGISMVYPFMLMLRLSTSDSTDKNSLEPLPTFWWDQDSLAKKYLLKRYYGLIKDPFVPEVEPIFGPMPLQGAEWTTSNYAELKDFWKSYYARYDQIPPAGRQAQLSDYRGFLATLPTNRYTTVDWDLSPGFLTFRAFLENRLRLPSSERGLLYLVRPDTKVRDWHPQLDKSYTASKQFLDNLEPEFRRPYYPSWVPYLKAKYGQFDIDKLNEAYGTRFHAWTEVRFPLERPTARQARADYDDFVLKSFPHIWLRVRGDHQRAWTEFLVKSQKIRTPKDWQTLTGLEVTSVDQIPFVAELPENEGWALMWSTFVHNSIKVEDRELRSPDRLYADYLRKKYPSVSALNQEWGTQFKDWSEVTYAEGLADYEALTEKAGSIRVALSTQPYQVALGQLTNQSAAITNTIILVVLSLIAALTVNPLAAYALSRFRIRGSHKILLFILATMALPAEVAMVPSFLLVRDLGLMNNYGALILPGAASAFGIFLLKGFFDSLPSELYEAATLDGAKELTIFARITIPLATPILAVTALGAVLGAYGTFLSAILYLQNSDMWPIMPKLYSLTSQGDADVTFGVNMAALVISSLPTFLVFLFAQRQIMRGIILPTFK